MLPACVAPAQYLERPAYEPLSARFVYAGAWATGMAPRSSNAAADSVAMRFSAWMPFIGLRQGPVDLYFGYTRYDRNGSSHPALVLGSTVATELLLAGRTESALLLPVLLSVDYTRAENGGAEADNFNVGSIGLGAGLRFRGGGERMDFSLGVTGCAHFSFEGFGAATGSSLAATGEGYIRWSDVPVAGGIVLGYRARVQTWSMSNDHLDYRLITHGPFLGVMF